MDAKDAKHLEHAIDLARRARERGDQPFGAVIVAADGTIVEGMNSTVTDGDPTGHAETNVVRAAASAVGLDALKTAVLYASTEPCAMCAGAVYWAGIPRLVYALGAAELNAMELGDEPTLDLPSREVLARGGRSVVIEGPADLPDARAVHEGFWS